MFGYVWLLGSCLAQKLDKKNWSHGCKEVFGGLSQRDLSQNIPMMCTESSTRHQRNCPDQAQGCLFQSVLMTNYINYILNHSTVVLAHGFLWKAAVFFFFPDMFSWLRYRPASSGSWWFWWGGNSFQETAQAQCWRGGAGVATCFDLSWFVMHLLSSSKNDLIDLDSFYHSSTSEIQLSRAMYLSAITALFPCRSAIIQLCSTSVGSTTF